MASGSGPSAWQHPKIFCILSLVFLCGSATGALALRQYYKQAGAKSYPYWKEGGKEISLQRFRKDLNLTDGQSKEVELVLDDFMKYYQTLQAQMDEVRANGKERILQILNPEQREKFGRMMNDLQSRQIR